MITITSPEGFKVRIPLTDTLMVALYVVLALSEAVNDRYTEAALFGLFSVYFLAFAYYRQLAECLRARLRFTRTDTSAKL